MGLPKDRGTSEPPAVSRKEANAVLAAALLLGLGFVLLLIWFDRTDFYHAHFFDAGVIVKRYQVARALFAFYLVWLVYSTGFLATSFFAVPDSLAALPWWERLPLCFLVGAGLWHLLMFAIGLAGLDVKPVAVGLACVAMLSSVPLLTRSLRNIWINIGAIRLSLSLIGAVQALLILVIVVTAVICFLVKGLYPAGGHDYFNHYSAFYRKVIETGSTQPNEVWYHFYYSKGCGLFFFAMLLTDPLAPQLVTAGFVGIGAVIVYALLRRATQGGILPLLGVLAFISFYIYTPGPIANMREGGWGDFEKVHELTAVLILAVVWITYRLYGSVNLPRAPWSMALHCAIASIAMLTFALPVLVGIYLTAIVAWSAFCARWGNALHALIAAAAAGFWLLLMAAINFIYTGFPSDQLIALFWLYANLERFLAWGTLFELLYFHFGVSGMTSQPHPSFWELPILLRNFLRLELWWPLVVSSIPLLMFQLWTPERRARVSARFNSHLWACLLAFMGAVILVALFGGGLRQPISFYRISTFSYGPMLCLSLLLWHLAIGSRHKVSPTSVTLSILTGAIFVASSAVAARDGGAARMFSTNLSSIVGNAAALWKGQLSIEGAYRNQQGWPGRLPFGAIYPAMEPVLQIVGPRTRIWSFHIHSYCMLPECNVQGLSSFRFSPSWQKVFFGSPDEAIDALKSENLNYFFFSSELQMQDVLPFAPIFSPDRIDRYLGIRWTDGVSYLLTWSSSDTVPIDPKFLAEYRKSVAIDEKQVAFVSGQWRRISDYVGLHKSDLHGFILPWCTNCQRLSDGVKQ
jgi:hypothetical protein